MSYQRAEKEIIQKRLQDEPRRFIQVIYGPRQVGKTTLVRQIIRDLNYPHSLVAADAVAATDQVWISQQWENARSKQQLPLTLPIYWSSMRFKKSITGASRSRPNGIEIRWRSEISV